MGEEKTRVIAPRLATWGHPTGYLDEIVLGSVKAKGHLFLSLARGGDPEGLASLSRRDCAVSIVDPSPRKNPEVGHEGQLARTLDHQDF